MRRILIAAAAFFLACGVLAAALFALAWTPGGVRLLERAANAALAGSVRLAGLRGPLLREVRIDRLQLLDPKGAWLEAADVEAAWSPRALWRGELKVNGLRVREVVLHRRPEPSQPGEAGGGLPIDLLLEAATVETLRLQPSAPGGPAAFAITADARLRRGGERVGALAVRRLDAPGSLTLSAQRIEGGYRLSGALAEPEGGALARLLALPGAPPLAVALEGEGSFNDFGLRFEASAGAAQADGEARLRRVEDGVEFAASADGVLAPLVPERFQALVAPEVRIAASGRFGFDGALRLDQLEARSEALAVKGAGALSSARELSGQAFASGRLTALGPALGREMEGDWRLDARFAGPLWEPRAEWRIGVEAPRVELASADFMEAEGALAVTSEALRLQAKGELRQPKLPDVQLPPTVAAEAAGGLRRDGAIAVERIDLRAGPYQAEASGEISPAGALDFALRARASDLAAAGLAGAVELEAELAGPLGELRAETVARFARLSLGAPPLDAAAGRAPTLSATLAQKDGRLAVERFEAKGAHASARGRGAWLRDRLEFTGALALPDLAALGAPATGRAEVEAALAGGSDALAGPLSFRIQSGAAQLAGRAQASFGRERIAIGDLRFEGSGLSGDGELTHRGDGKGPEGRLALAATDLRPWTTALGAPASGRLNVNATISGAEFRARAQGWDLVWRELRAKEAELTARLDGLPHGPKGFARMSAERAGYGETDVRRFRLSSRIEEDEASFHLRAEAPDRLDAPLSASGGVRWGDGAANLSLARIDGRIAERAVRLARPVILSWRGGAWSLEGLDLRVGRGRLAGRGRYDSQHVEAQIFAEALPMAPFLEDFSGDLDGELRLAGPLTATEAAFHARLAATGAVWGADLSGMELEGRGEWRSGRARLLTWLSGAPGTAASAELSLPFVADFGSGRFAAPSQGELRGRLEATADLGLLAPLLPLEDRIAGRLDAQLALSGTLAAPHVVGEANLEDGRYVLRATGASLRDVRVRLRGDGSRIVLEELSGADGAEGRLRGQGDLSLAERRLDARFEFARLRVADTDEVKAQASGALALAGPLHSPMLAGDVEAHRAEFAIPRRLPARVARLEVVEINRRAEARPRPAARPGPPAFNPKLDVRVRAPGRLFVRGRGLDSEWKGAVRVTGAAAAPQFDGALEAVRGRFDLAGRVLELDRGAVSFAADRRGQVEPQLDVAATARAGDALAEVRVVGPLSEIRIELSSQPSLPRDEILARLLFGKGAGALGPGQIVQLGQTALELSGEGATGGLLGEVRRRLGLDFLDVESGTGGQPLAGAQLRAGKYLSDDVYVGLRQGALPGSSSAVIEYEFLPNLSVEGTVGADSQAGVGLNWESRY